MSLKINFTKVIINKEFIRGRLELVNDTDYTLNKLKINIELLNGDIHAHTLKENSDTDIKPRSKKVWLVEDLYEPSFIYNKFNPHVDIEKASNSKGQQIDGNYFEVEIGKFSKPKQVGKVNFKRTFTIIGKILLAVVFVFILKIRDDSSRNENSVKDQVSEKSIFDDSLQADCNTSFVNGDKVKFRDSKIKGITKADICSVAENFIQKTEKSHASYYSNICQKADITANNLGGYSRLRQIGLQEENSNNRNLVALMLTCEPSIRKQSINKSLSDIINTQAIYSIGHFEYTNKKCIGYLIEYSSKNSTFYGLVGTKDCAEDFGDSLKYNLFHPKNNPNGQSGKSFIKDNLKYDGELPEYFFYEGQKYKF